MLFIFQTILVGLCRRIHPASGHRCVLGLVVADGANWLSCPLIFIVAGGANWLSCPLILIVAGGANLLLFGCGRTTEKLGLICFENIIFF